MTNIRVLDTTRQLEAAVLGYRHEDLLWYATGKNDHPLRSHEYIRTAEQTADKLTFYVDTPEEQEVWATIRGRLTALHDRPEAPALTAEVRAWPASGLSALIQDFEAYNEAQMEESIRTADYPRGAVSHWTLGLAVSTVVLLLSGALGFVRRVVRPALSVTCAAGTFDQGDFSVRAPILHEDELGALARIA